MAKTQDPQPPQSFDAERAVLGSVLKDNEAMTVAAEQLTAQDFYYPKHRAIFAACMALTDKLEPVDLTTTANELYKDKMLAKCGGRTYLVDLAECVASTANIEHHCRIVKEKATRRKVVQVCGEIQRSAYTEDQTLDELLGSAERGIIGLGERVVSTRGVRLSSILPSVMEDFDEWQRGEAQKKLVRTGFSAFDSKLHGMMNGELWLIAGRPSQGKTQAALQISEYVALNQRIPVSVHSLEMSGKMLGIRMITANAHTSYDDIRSRRITSEGWDRLRDAQARLAGANIFIDDIGGLTPNVLRVKARRLKARENIGLIVVDYVQLMEAPQYTGKRVLEISYISRQLKLMAKELDIPVLALSQLSRQNEQGGNRRPRLSDLRDSGALEQDADGVMFVWHDNDNNAWWITDKNRMGIRSKMPMNFIDGRWESRSGRSE